MAIETPRRGQPEDAQDRRLRRSWLSLVVAFGALAVLTALHLVIPDPRLSAFVLALVLVVGVAGLLHRRVIAGLEDTRRLESESFQRILQGLSRSVSPDAIVEAIVEDLGVATGADHTVVVRLRADSRILEATLVSSRAGVPSSTTVLPISDLEDHGPMQGRDADRSTTTLRDGRVRVAVRMGEHDDATDRSDVGFAAVGARPAEGERGVGEDADARPPIRRGIRLETGGGFKARPDEWATDPGRAGESRARPRLRVGVGTGRGTDSGGAGPPAAERRVAEQLAARVRTIYGLKNTIATALVTEQGVVGGIVLSHRTADAWRPASQRMLTAAAEEASAALARAYSFRDAETRASTDALTGLPNRRYFEEFCGLLARRRRAEDAVGVLMIDIDHFKRLNDEFGHPVGDQVLRAVAGAIGAAVRDGDVPARFGGEEFAVLLRNPGPDVAFQVGERVRAAVNGLDLSALGPAGVTVSVGVAVSRSVDEPIADLVGEADQALYRAKRMGRDRVAVA